MLVFFIALVSFSFITSFSVFSVLWGMYVIIPSIIIALVPVTFFSKCFYKKSKIVNEKIVLIEKTWFDLLENTNTFFLSVVHSGGLLIREKMIANEKNKVCFNEKIETAQIKIFTYEFLPKYSWLIFFNFGITVKKENIIDLPSHYCNVYCKSYYNLD
jgi:hypothetical protein